MRSIDRRSPRSAMRDQGAVPSMIPQGAGSAPLPGMDLKKRGKLMCVKVCLLNQTTAVFHLGHKALGEALFDEVCRYLNLLEKDYFGLEFLDCYGNRCWLDKEKTILRQITQAHSDGKFYFVVKFYTPNPSELEEEYTRYLLSLQIKRDLAMGEFICIENTAALMVAYLVQSECGDFSPDDYPDHSYLSARNFVPNQTIPFQIKVMQNHKQLIGMNPAESEFALLETARRCDFYGVKFHAAKDVEASAVNLSVVHGGIKVFQNLHFVTTFSWAKIRKLSFKRKKLLIKLHPESYQFYKETIEFGFETRNECKNFWKKCVEHHAFFRCVDVAETKKPKESRLFSRGSSFRYHGRTQKQLIDYVREHHKRREPFTRPINAGLSLERDRLARLHYGLGPSGYATLERKQQKPVSFTSSMPHIGQAPAQGTASVSGATFTPFTVSTTVAHPPRSRPASQYYYRNHSDHLSDDLSGDERMCTSDIDTSTTTAAAAEKPQRRFPEKQQTPMSLSLPNVLSDDVRLVCREFELQCECPPKSVSGDNFLERLGADDNVSEDSYRLADHESSQPNILNTTFTAKRVGNVIVKRIMAKSTPNTTDDEESTASESAPVHRKALRPSAKYYSPFHPQATSLTRTTAPIEIDGPNVKLPAPLPSEAPTYTSTGALLVRPKLIDVAKENGASERSGAYKTFSEKRPEVYAVPPTLNGVSGPLPGRVLARDNIVITPEGIKEKRPKPVVPPKPKNLPRPVVHMHDVDDTVSEPIMPPPPTATSPKAQSEVLQMPTVDSAISGPPKESTRSAPLQKSKSEDLMKRPPTLISVESVDQPEVKKCHLFNSEIPYVLTMRTVEAPSQERQSPAATSFGGGRRKSFDFVPKKHLPSPGSFSSQDHSVSPTTPDSGNVLEYVLRRRSLSSERAQKERRRRHLTQPIRLDDAGPVEALHKLSRSQELCEFHDDLPPPPEAPRSPPEDLNNEPMPSPPPPPPPPTSGASSGTPPYIDDSSSKEEEGAAPPPAVAATHDGAPKSLRTPSGLLWTDF